MKQPLKIKWRHLTVAQKKEALAPLNERLKAQKDAPTKLYMHNVYAMSFNIHSKTGAVLN